MLTEKKKTIAVLSVSAGVGHLRAAEAIKQAAEQNFPEATVHHIDIIDLSWKIFRKIYCDLSFKLAERHPGLWGFFYNKTDRLEVSRLQRFRAFLERLSTRKLRKKLKQLQPDHVICTHYLPAALISRLIAKGKYHVPCWVQVTDFDLHAWWVHPHMAGYFAATDEVACQMRDRGIAAEQIHVTGIPIMPVFKQRQSREQCAAELGLDPAKTTLLMMSGGSGVGGLDKLAARLLDLDQDLQIIALAGKNKKLLNGLAALAARRPRHLVALPFTRTIERVMSASDLAISKPGGLTTSECLAMGLPMIVVSPIPGQEDRNADYLLEHGAALKTHNAAGLEFRLRLLLNEPERLRKMARAAKRLGRPDAARDVFSIVIESGEDKPQA